MNFKRHALLELSDWGREEAFEFMKEQTCCKGSLEQLKELVITGYNGVKIPAIVRRREDTARNDVCAVGFSSPFLHDGNRLRIPGFVAMSEIQRIVTPYEVLTKEISKRTNALTALDKIRNIAEKNDVTLGVFGSTALEIYTSLAYTHKSSDLDLIIRVADLDKIENFYHSIIEIGDKYNCRVDLELELDDCEIKVAELFTDTKHILGKGMGGVQLYTRENVLQWINF